MSGYVYLEVIHSLPRATWSWGYASPEWWGIYNHNLRRYVAQCPTRDAALAALRLLSGGES